MIDYLTCKDVAALYHVTATRIRFLAKHRGIGQHLYLHGPWVFTPEEAERMKPGKAGSLPGPRGPRGRRIPRP